MGVIAMAVDHQMDVHIPQTRQHGHAFGRDHLGVFWDRQGSSLADGFDPFSIDDNDAVAKRLSAVAVNQRSSDQSFYFLRLRDGSSRLILKDAGGNQRGADERRCKQTRNRFHRMFLGKPWEGHEWDLKDS